MVKMIVAERKKMIDALNSLEVTEWCGSGGELEYVMADNNENNRAVLLNAGFTEQAIHEATNNSFSDEIDLLQLAVEHALIHCWISGRGFVEEREYIEWINGELG